MATKIGSQHGITAMHNVFRDQWPDKTLLKKKDGVWPSISTLTQPLDQWKAIDKHERTETILVQDHDAANPSNGGGPPPPIILTRDLSRVQNVLIMAELDWDSLNSPPHYDIWVTADMGYRHYYEDGAYINEAKHQRRRVCSWCDCKAVLGNGTAPQVAIDMAREFDLDDACGEGEHSLAFEDGYKAGMRTFVVNMSALTQAQIDLVNADNMTVLTAELYWNLQPDKPVDWKNCVGVGSNCGALYQTSSESTHPVTQDTYANNPACVYETMSWYCGGKPAPDYARLP